MIELTEMNVVEYLRKRGAVGNGEVLVKSLSGGVAGIVLKIMDVDYGEPLGTDMRTESQKKRGVPDKRMREGRCFVIKQPLEKFRTKAEWFVDRDRIWVERDALQMLVKTVPAGGIPEVLWSDEDNFILAVSAAPAGALNWKSELLAGRVDKRCFEAAARFLAAMHAGTAGQKAFSDRFGEPRLFIQQRINPYLNFTAQKHPELADELAKVSDLLLKNPICLIHGDYSPKNMLVIPEPDQSIRLMLLDFEVNFYGHPSFDAATLINHLLLKGFHHGQHWRRFMLAADGFWHIYQARATKPIAKEVTSSAGRVLGALMLARIDGKSPVEYITDEALKDRVRQCAAAILKLPDTGLDLALDTAGEFLDRE
ncbi:MAG TPA: phosphotransferase [Phycisphaerae bacterium]|nr:phosphotransferase [Phycisphaerae bacterium]